MSIKNFSDLRKSSQKFDDLAKNLKTKGKKDYDDPRFWKYSLDKAGNTEAVFRFLPTAKGDDWPFVTTYEHNFKGPTGQYYIEKCLSTINQPDPVNEMNAVLWNSGAEADRKIVSGVNGKNATKRRTKYISNILVISDSGNPENNGKLFLFSYGEKVYEQIASAMNPKFSTVKAFDPFDFWTGRNFNLRLYKKNDQVQYDQCGWDTAPSPLLEGDEAKLQALWETQHALSEFINPKNFKAYDLLKKRLDMVMKGAVAQGKTIEDEIKDEPSLPSAKEPSAEELMESLPPWQGEADNEDLASLAKMVD